MTSIKKPSGRNTWTFICAAVVCMVSPGCVLAPPGTTQEQHRLDQHSQFQRPLEQRELPLLPSPATWQDVLRQAFLTNGELESAWFEWKAAMARIDQAAAWPNSSLMVGHGYMFSGGKMTVMAILMGLLPIMWSSGTGADMMKRIAAPMVGGIVTSFLLELLIYPVIYVLWKSWGEMRSAKSG